MKETPLKKAVFTKSRNNHATVLPLLLYGNFNCRTGCKIGLDFRYFAQSIVTLRENENER